MSDTPAAAPAKKKGGKKKLIWIALCVVCLVAGAAVPMVVNVPAMMGKGKEDEAAKKKKKKGEEKVASVPFTDAVVNLADDRMTRYLRVKIVLLTTEEHEKELTDLVTKHKAAMKSWMISHLAGKTIKDVAGSVGINRVQRELFERFEDMLYPNGDGHLKNVLFEEYVVQ